MDRKGITEKSWEAASFQTTEGGRGSRKKGYSVVIPNLRGEARVPKFMGKTRSPWGKKRIKGKNTKR